MSTDAAAVLAGVSKAYKGARDRRNGARKALDDVSLELNRGTVVGLVGPNGAGKSTLMGLIAGLLRPDAGTISVHGHPAGSRHARKVVALMPEVPSLLPRYTPFKTLVYYAALWGRRGKSGRLRADELLARLGLDDVRDKPAGELSQGMRQKLGIAVALVGAPQVLLLDEPSNGLDPEGVVSLRQLILEQADEGKLILVSSHRLGELERLTSQFIFLASGRIQSRGHDWASPRLRVICNLKAGLPAAVGIPAKVSVENGRDCLIFEVKCADFVPGIVRGLVDGGADIHSVSMEREDLESAYLKFRNERAKDAGN